MQKETPHFVTGSIPYVQTMLTPHTSNNAIKFYLQTGQNS